MGTSQSSKGSPSGTPIIPNWVPGSVTPEDNPQGKPPEAQGSHTGVSEPIPIAQRARFKMARQKLGNFANSGSLNDLRKGVGHYFRDGLGGTKTAVQRFNGTARTAGTLFNTLSAIASHRAASPGSPLDPKLLSGKNAQEIMDAIAEAVQPIEGTLDDESSQRSIHNALSSS